MATGNVIERIIRLILDKAAAARAERDAKKTASVIEGALGGLKRAALAVGSALAAAFGLRALIRFGQEAVRAAIHVERVWADLRGTVEATGQSFTDIEGDLRALGDVFQDVTVHDSEDFAESLSRLITITGDVGASTNNMGLVANVAAQFFKGELAPAVELVSKVMNGNLTLLQRMGIRVKSAQEGLDVLASRSFGAAERAAGTFGGRLAQLNNLWDDFKEEVGDALISADGTTGALDVLRASVQGMIRWVKENKDELRTWITQGINAATDAVKALTRAWITFQQVRGKASLLTGTAAAPLADTEAGLKAQMEGFKRQRAQLEKERAALVAESEKFGTHGRIATAIIEFGRPDAPVKRLTASLQENADALELVERNAAAAQEKLATLGQPDPKKPNLFNAPQVGSGNVGESEKKVTEALEAFDKAMKSARTNAALLGDDFDFLGAKSSALETVMKALGEEGISASDRRMRNFAEQLQSSQVAGTLADFQKTMDGITLTAELMGPQFDRDAAEADALRAVIGKLSTQVEEGDSTLGAYRQRLADLEPGIRNIVREFERMEDVADFMRQIIPRPKDEEPAETQLMRLREEAESLTAVLQRLAEQGLGASDPRMAAYADRLREIMGQMELMQEEAKTLAEVTATAGEIVGASLTGGLGPFAQAKAKANLIRAAEETAEGIAAAFSLFGAANAPKHFALSAKFTAIAGAWASFGGAIGGGGGGGGSLGGAQGLSRNAAQRVDTRPEVHVHIPERVAHLVDDKDYQRMIFVGQERFRETAGQNVKIIYHRGSR